MQRYDFWFQVLTGTMLIILVCFLAIGLSVDYPLWVSFIPIMFALPGVFFCAYAYWRARKRAANLALFFLCIAAYFGIATLGLRQEHGPDNPSTASLVLATTTCLCVGVALLILDRVLVKRFGSKPVEREVVVVHSTDSLAGPSPAWKAVTRTGRFILFIFCLFLSRLAVGPKFEQDWSRVVLFVVVLLLSSLVSGLLSEDTIARLLSVVNFKQK